MNQENSKNENLALIHKRVLHAFDWIPPHARRSMFPGAAPVYWPNKETRKPLFWCSPGLECWFVNQSEETLPYVGALSAGFVSGDDVTIPVTSAGYRYYYENVLPGEAVLVEDIEFVFESDYVLQVQIETETQQFGKLELWSESGKGGIPETIFIWNTGEFGKYVHVKQIKSD